MSSRQPACNCLADPDTILDAAPEMEWKCSQEHMCRHAAVIANTTVKVTDNIKDQRNSEKVRGLRQKTNWLSLTLTASLSIIVGSVLLLFIVRGRPSDELPVKSTPIRNLTRLVYYDEWQKKMTLVCFVQVLGLASVGGSIYYRSGLDVGERVFREKIAFIFWMCAFWSIGTIYSSIVTYFSDSWTTHDCTMLYKKSSKIENNTMSRIRTYPEELEFLEALRGNNSMPIQEDLRVSILSYHIVRWFVGLALSSPYTLLFAMVTDSLTQMAPSATSVFLSSLILLLTQQSFDALGRLLAEISGRKAVSRAVCFGTIVSQALVVAGGFYRTVNPVLSAICPIRYSFSAISKLHFSSADSFWCTPDRASAWRGYTWCSLELSGAVADLKFRGIDIINSYRTPSVWPDVLSLMAIITVLRAACLVVACIKARTKQKRKILCESKEGMNKDTVDHKVNRSSDDKEADILDAPRCNNPRGAKPHYIDPSESLARRSCSESTGRPAQGGSDEVPEF